eukprot:CCRYP_018441-RA/>CCRYP_018441-RA protein AED:0.26 eAED:0.26 QI:0/0/0/1/0.25/0.4/5/0/619
MFPSLFAQRLIDAIMVECRQDVEAREGRYVREVRTDQRHSSVTPERISCAFGIGLNAAKQTIAVTTQKGIQHEINPLSRKYCVDHLGLHCTKLRGQWYLGHLSAQKRSKNKNTGAYMFTNGDFTEAYPVEWCNNTFAAMSIYEFCTHVGTPGELKLDRAPELVGSNSELYKTACKQHIDITYAKPKCKNQIWPVDFEIPELKKRIRNKMGYTGYEEVTGHTPDISEFLDFDFWDFDWYWPGVHPSISEHDRRLLRWASVSSPVASNMCYWIIPVIGNPDADTTVQHVTQDDMADPTIKEMIDACNSKLTKNLDDSNFDNPDLNDFHLTDDLSLLDEHTCNCSPLDLAYRDNDTTPMMKTMPSPRPEEDDVALDAYDKLFGTQIKLDDGLKASIKRHVTDLNGIPIGTAHVNMLLDTRQHEMEFKDGTTDAYFANIIAKKLYSQVDSGGHGLVAFKEISDHRKNQHAISKDDGYVISKNGSETPKWTTMGCGLLLESRDGSSDWTQTQLMAEYAVANKIAEEPAFAWWVSFCVDKQNRIINKVKSKYWRTTHKYVRVTYGVHNEHTPEEIRAGKAPKITGYQEITATWCLMLRWISQGKNILLQMGPKQRHHSSLLIQVW